MKPPPPYYAVIFTSKRTIDDGENYGKTGDRMVELAAQQAGYLGHESARDPETRLGITVSYWENLESIRAWKQNAEHLEAQQEGRDSFYEGYVTRVCKVEREYSFGEI